VIMRVVPSGRRMRKERDSQRKQHFKTPEEIIGRTIARSFPRKEIDDALNDGKAWFATVEKGKKKTIPKTARKGKEKKVLGALSCRRELALFLKKRRHHWCGRKKERSGRGAICPKRKKPTDAEHRRPSALTAGRESGGILRGKERGKSKQPLLEEGGLCFAYYRGETSSYYRSQERAIVRMIVGKSSRTILVPVIMGKESTPHTRQNAKKKALLRIPESRWYGNRAGERSAWMRGGKTWWRKKKASLPAILRKKKA